VDALAPGLVTVAAAFLAGIVYGTSELPATEGPTPARLEEAARDGLGSRVMRDEALAWWDVAFEGLAQLGPAFASERVIRRAGEFRRDFTERARDPGDAEAEWVEAAYDVAG
jgi:hypothetical protein